MQVGPYELGRPLGRGGSGAVYEARGPRGEPVAIKLLAHATPEARARFAREVRLLRELSATEGFVPLLDAGAVRGVPWIAMPLLAGGTLRDRLARGPLPVADAVELGRALARALARAHERGVVHRDVKPENVLFDASGRPLVSDLGLGKHVVATDASADLSRSATFRGTAGYAAPEQLDAKSVGPPADVFALGAVLHECLTGAPAFEGASPLEVLARVAKGDFAPLGTAPPWLAAVVARALAPDPAERFPDAGVLADALAAGPGRRSLLPRALVFGGGAAVVTAAALAVVAPGPGRAPPPPPVAADADEVRDRVERLRRAGDLRGALAAVSQALEGRPEDAEMLLLRSQLRVHAHDPSGARADVDRAIAARPDAGLAWSHRAMVRWAAGDAAGAEADAQRGVELEPRRPEALSARAFVAFETGRHGDAVRDFTLALALDPAAPLLARRGCARFKAGDAGGALLDLDAGVARGERGDALALRAEVKVHRGDAAGALSDAERAIALNPRSAAAWRARARVRLQAGRSDEALPDLEQALALRPDPEALALRGGVFSNRGELARALADLDRAIELDPRCGVAHTFRAVTRSKLPGADPALVRADHDRAVELEPWSIRALSGRAAFRLQSNDGKGAEEDAERLIALAPGSPDGWRTRGIARVMATRADAVPDLERATALAPRDGVALGHLGIAYVIAGRNDDALDPLERGLALAPEQGEALATRGMVVGLRGEHDRAIADATAALALPISATASLMARRTRARARHAKGDPRGALEDLDAAVALAPAIAVVRIDRARVRKATGDARGAIEDYERALALEKNAAVARELEALRSTVR